MVRTTYFQEWKKFNIDDVEQPKDLIEVVKYLTGHENISSKRWVYEYDSMVGTVNMSTNTPYRCYCKFKRN